MNSSYYDESAVKRGVDAGIHREMIGGLWDEIGDLQMAFLRSQGLSSASSLLDIGCGSLRLGVRAVDYLDANKYWGTDLNHALMEAGYQKEIAPAGLAEKLPPGQLVEDGEFRFPGIPPVMDFAIAQSVFTHLPVRYLRQCLVSLGGHLQGPCTFFATFFIVPAGEFDGAFSHQPGDVVTHPGQDPYHYRLEDLSEAAQGTPWRMDYIGDWSHPRAQQMAAFRKD
jgi:hypothetical protein